MFGLGIVGTIILILVILWILGVIGCGSSAIGCERRPSGRLFCLSLAPVIVRSGAFRPAGFRQLSREERYARHRALIVTRRQMAQRCVG
jgi:hypothetical protein